MIIKNLLRIFKSYKLLIFNIIFFELIYIVLGYKGNRITHTKNSSMADNIPCPYFFLYKITQKLKIYKFKNFVDLGCGSGRVIGFFNKKFKSKFFFGIEYDLNEYKFAKKIFKENKNILISNSNFLGFKHNKFKADCYFLNNPFTSDNTFKKFINSLIKQIPNNKKVIFVFVNFNFKVIKSIKKIELVDKYEVTNIKGYSIGLLNN